MTHQLLFCCFNPHWPGASSGNQHIKTLFWSMYLPGNLHVEQTLRIAGSFQQHGIEQAIWSCLFSVSPLKREHSICIEFPLVIFLLKLHPITPFYPATPPIHIHACSLSTIAASTVNTVSTRTDTTCFYVNGLVTFSFVTKPSSI